MMVSRSIIFAAAILLAPIAGLATAPLAVDVGNNVVNIPGTMISEQIHRDYAQLSLTPDVISSITNSGGDSGLWRTNLYRIYYTASDSRWNGWGLALGDGCIVIGGLDGLIYRSVNNGVSWSSNDYGAGFFSRWAFCPPARDVVGNIYCGTITGTTMVIHKSIDRGASWLHLPTDRTVGEASRRYSFAVSERGDVVVYYYDASASNCYVLVSHDFATWSQIEPTWQTGPYAANGGTVQMAYLGNGTFVGADGGGEIFRSHDYGDTWAFVTNGLAGSIYGGQQGRGVLLKYSDRKIYLTKDYGQTWRYISTVDSKIVDLMINVYGGYWLYPKQTGGLQYTPDDFVSSYTVKNIPQNLNNINWPTHCLMDFNHDGIYLMSGARGSGNGATNLSLVALDTSDLNIKKSTPIPIPVISGSPVAFPGSVYSDGANFYRSTNGTTWVIF